MKKIYILTAVFFLMFIWAMNAKADLDDFLSGLNVQAKADIGGFNGKLSAQFGIPLPQVQAIVKTVVSPADAFMCFQLSLMTNVHIDRVLQVYKSTQTKGWGVIAKELGIKPGSSEFQALKRGDFFFTGKGSVKAGKGEGKGSNKSKGRKK
jgi:hypothetical protein